MLDNKTLKRFWDKVDKSQDCWNWTAYKLDGRGRFRCYNKMMYSSRVSWYIHHGYFPNLLVCHKCDNPSCVNPNHLFLGTNSDNHKDRDIKGRNGKSKLTNEQITFILKSKENTKYLMNYYQVSYDTIHRIKKGNSWKHINRD